MVLSSHHQITIALFIAFILSIEIRPSSSAVRNRRESDGTLFAHCPQPEVVQARSRVTRVWWNTPEVHHHLVRSLRRTGFPPGSLFPEGRHSIIYEAEGFDGTISTCEINITIIVRQCQDVTPISPTRKRCSNNNMANSQCKFYCPPRYQLVGSSSVTCTNSRAWSGTFPICRLIACDTLIAPDHSSMRCSIPPNRQGSWCEFRCYIGYEMIGSSVRTCLLDQWSGIQPTCKDFRPPTFVFCPRLVRVRSEDGTASALVEYVNPIAVDSSNVNTELISGQLSGERFPLGINRIHYRAEDESGNIANCIFYIQVFDNQPPQFDFCPSPIHAFSTTLSTAIAVTYGDPTATDNSSPTSVNVTRVFGDASGSMFFPGVHAIHYQATDEAGNKAYCNFYIVVKVSPCIHLAEKENLQMSCSDDLYHPDSWCTFKCNEGFILFGSATRICEKTGWSGQEAICTADVTFIAGGNENISKGERSTSTPLEMSVTSSGELAPELITSIMYEYEDEN